MTEAFKPTIEILVYFNYEDYKNMLSDKLGIDRKDFRDFMYDGKKYDLWYWFMDEICYGEVHNGSYQPVWYCDEDDIESETEEWKKKVMLAHNEVVKELEELGEHDVTLYIYW